MRNRKEYFKQYRLENKEKLKVYYQAYREKYREYHIQKKQRMVFEK